MQNASSMQPERQDTLLVGMIAHSSSEAERGSPMFSRSGHTNNKAPSGSLPGYLDGRSLGMSDGASLRDAVRCGCVSSARCILYSIRSICHD